MVDWDRVEDLHNKGQSWEEIASDPKVGFHPDRSVSQAGPALRRLYYRRKSREQRQPAEEPTIKRYDPNKDTRWTLARIGYLIVPLVAIWFVLALIYPSPLGLILAAIPYIAIILAVGVFILAFGLLRTNRRWSKVFRSTVIVGVVLGLVFTGAVALTAIVIGCPFLPSSSALTSQPGPGWAATPSYVSPWQQGGLPVIYFYGASWCPYCSASSWAIWKALTEFQTGFSSTTSGIPGTTFSYSSSTDVYPSTPEVVLANAQLTSGNAVFLVSEYTGGVDGTFPGTSNCIQQAYVTAYSGSSIPFLVVNGQYVHGGSTIIDPADWETYSGGANGGYSAVATGVLQESGTPWSVVQGQAAWITAYIVKASGEPMSYFVSTYTAKYQWTSEMQSLVSSDLSQI